MEGSDSRLGIYEKPSPGLNKALIIIKNISLLNISLEDAGLEGIKDGGGVQELGGLDRNGEGQ